MPPHKRRSWAKLHLWLGAVIGAFWMVQATTGMLLVFSRDLELLTVQQLGHGPLLPPSAILRTAQLAAHAPIMRLTTVGPEPRLLEAQYRDATGEPRAIRLDGTSGHLITQQDRKGNVSAGRTGWQWIYLVHTTLLLGPTGKIVIGISGLFLLTTLVVGARLAWPKWGQWKSLAQSARWKNGVQRSYGWHRLIGMLALLPLGVLATTGVYMTFGGDQMLLAPERIARASERSADIGADRALAAARRVIPDGTLMSIELPRPDRFIYTFRFTEPNELRRWAGRAVVIVEPATGRVRASYDPARATSLQRLEDAIYAVHVGEAGGGPGRALVLLAGSTIPLLGWLGLKTWSGKRSARSKSRSSPSGANGRAQGGAGRVQENTHGAVRTRP